MSICVLTERVIMQPSPFNELHYREVTAREFCGPVGGAYGRDQRSGSVMPVRDARVRPDQRVRIRVAGVRSARAYRFSAPRPARKKPTGLGAEIPTIARGAGRIAPPRESRPLGPLDSPLMRFITL